MIPEIGLLLLGYDDIDLTDSGPSTYLNLLFIDFLPIFKIKFYRIINT